MHIQTTWTSRALSRTECRGRGPGEQTGLIALTASRSSGSKLAEAKHLPMLALCVDILRGSELKLSSLSTAQRCTCKKYRAQEQPLFDLFCRCWSITHSHAKMQKCENAEEGWRICGMWTIDCVVSAFRPRRNEVVREFKRSTGHLPGNLGTPTKTSLSCMIQASASCIFNYYLFILPACANPHQPAHTRTDNLAPLARISRHNASPRVHNRPGRLQPAELLRYVAHARTRPGSLLCLVLCPLLTIETVSVATIAFNPTFWK